MKIQTISKSDFKKIEGSRRVIVNDHPHQFAVLNLGEPLGCYGLSWGSDIITPVVELSTAQRTLWIGVDQRLAAINLQDGNIRLAMPLHTNIFQILIVDDLIAVLTELEVLLFNSDCSIRCFQGLPDLSSEISVSGSDFVIQLFDGSSLTLTRRGTFKESAYCKAEP